MARRILIVDYLSQPCRAVALLVKAAGIEVDIHEVDIAKGEHKIPECPLGKVPVLCEANFTLIESGAIMRYLANPSSIPDHYYPEESRKRARVESCCDWHHLNTRRGCAGLVFNRVVAHWDGKPTDAKAANDAEVLLTAALQTLETYWLADSAFVAGGEVSIADILLLTELDMLHLLAWAQEGKSREALLAPFPKVQDWMSSIADKCAPHHADVSASLMEKAAAAPSQQKTADKGR